MTTENKSSDLKLVACLMCEGECSQEDAVNITILGQLESGVPFIARAWVCWFCVQDVDKPLNVHACLVPYISRDSHKERAAVAPSFPGKTE